MNTPTEIRTVEATVTLYGKQGRAMHDLWVKARNRFTLTKDRCRDGAPIHRVVMGYYKACNECGWADPTTHQTEEEARIVAHWHGQRVDMIILDETHVIPLRPAPPEPCDEELPGMWSRSDFT